MCKHFKSRFPSFNVLCRNEPVATDTIYSDTPVIDNGTKCTQLFIGRNTLVADIYDMKTDKKFSNTLKDNTRRRGAMDRLISNQAKQEISIEAKDILRALFIEKWQSESHHQHSNLCRKTV